MIDWLIDWLIDYPLRQVWIYIFKIWLMNLELTLSKILTVLNMTFDDFNDIFFMVHWVLIEYMKVMLIFWFKDMIDWLIDKVTYAWKRYLLLNINITFIYSVNTQWGCYYVCLFDGVLRHFQQYFSYIVAVSFIGGKNRRTRRKPLTSRKSLTNFIT
jgi:hypothetical protein